MIARQWVYFPRPKTASLNERSSAKQGQLIKRDVPAPTALVTVRPPLFRLRACGCIAQMFVKLSLNFGRALGRIGHR
ncbi:hypothetical protein [Bradyrhizobium sp. ARR65]|uniref:hypothetical protein n=1 Tax=Bradyrhizobium sp. ARR65 TaxID=1040989 RepID=UPI000463C707|nr:hypothetical protein [Bradyrhizobium sp. ARR65]